MRNKQAEEESEKYGRASEYEEKKRLMEQQQHIRKKSGSNSIYTYSSHFVCDVCTVQREHVLIG